MNSETGDKPYNLEQRTFQFAKESRTFVKRLPRTITNFEDVKQLVRASGSIGANYIEANECIGKKDFVMKIKTCRREAKESAYWLRLLAALTGCAYWTVVTILSSSGESSPVKLWN